MPLQQRHSKLAEIRQRKTLLLQKQADHHRHKASTELNNDNNAPVSHRERRPAQPPIENDDIPSMLHIKSHSEVPLSDFKNVDSQLASIKQQLEVSKNKQRIL